MDLAQQLALLADRLRDISALGLMYSTGQYDLARYRAVQDISIELLALATQEPPAAFEPLRAPVLSHATPFAVGDAAVFDDAGRLLLIQRADNRCWALPGGALEVGETPAAGVEREAFEETGVRVQAQRLVGVFDSRLAGAASRHHMYQFIFLCRPLDQSHFGQGSHRHEILQAQWFAPEALPAQIDPGHITRLPEAYRVWRGDQRPFFDTTTPSQQT